MVYSLIFGEDFGCNLLYTEKVILDACNVSDITNEHDMFFNPNEFYSKTHPSGWTIIARLRKDFYVWIEIFTAYHPIYGMISAVLNRKIVADSRMGWHDFKLHHKLEIIDSEYF